MSIQSQYTIHAPVGPGYNQLLYVCMNKYYCLTYLKAPHLFLTHRNSKHASKALTAKKSTIPTTITVKTTVPSFSMVPMEDMTVFM